MNDNLRYISLQYIKGENYEKITCFNSDDIAKIQKILKEPFYIEGSFKLLEDILKIEKRDIGESLLDDLINYISLQSLKEPIKEGIENKKGSLKNLKKKALDANKDSSKKLKELKELITKLEKKNNELNNLEEDTDEDTDEYNEIKKKLLDMLNLSNLLKIYNISDTQYANYIEYEDIDETFINKFIFNQFEKTIYDTITHDDVIKAYICQYIKKIKKIALSTIKKSELFSFAEEVLSFLKMLVKFETLNNDDEKKENKSSIDNLEKLIKIFKKYLYICENNIKKYEKIFDHNDIGNIDEAFMIESYSKFLKKLYKLKQNLESKDTEKIKRELINSLDQFFNLHGFNSPEKIESKAEIDYIVQRILNYT